MVETDEWGWPGELTMQDRWRTRERKVRIFRPIKEGDLINIVGMHPLRWAQLKLDYGIDEEVEQIHLVGIQL